jgi:two-component system, chemotaxis family, protein-glutamate methylesterase/glutaminase
LPELKKKRVLIVDDAIVVRRMLSDAIEKDLGLEVAGTASNGRLALTKFPSLKPDIVLLDLEMPEMDGLEAVRELRKIDARVPIIIFSTLSEHGASATLEALSLGATDYVTKPSTTNMGGTLHTVAQELIPKIRALCRMPEALAPVPVERSSFAGIPRVLKSTSRRPSLGPVHIVVIGASTGGPDALARLIPALPANLSVPVLIVQHMPPTFTSMLAARLCAKSAVPVHECVSGEPLKPGSVFLAPGDQHMVVSVGKNGPCVRLNQGPKENFCRPSVDVLFRSVAETFGSHALALVLTGMGHDGLKGCEILHQAGSRIMVQDEASSVVWGMPGLVARAGLADRVLPLHQMAVEISRAANGEFHDEALPAKLSV